MRVLVSTYQPTDADLDEEQAEALADLARTGTLHRRSAAINSHGQTDTEMTVRSYLTEAGEQRWAFIHQGPEISEVIDSADEAEAETTYEEEVRGLAECAGEDDVPMWTETDVDRVAEDRYTVTVQRRTGGVWETFTGEAQIGAATALPVEYRLEKDDVQTLMDAAPALAAAIVAQQAETNAEIALWNAVGESSSGRSFDAVRVTVTGVGPGGAAEYTEEREIPTAQPTAEEVAALRRHLEADRARYDTAAGTGL
ncbi:hypothetical protein ACFY9F_36115 [Streptomyces sp. NPDC012421]|uniref:hypothetical protein n=1 Tax=Streptomyces sp. NPDC012421 TaxID=3364832 RepID=UPI0036EB3733